REGFVEREPLSAVTEATDMRTVHRGGRSDEECALINKRLREGFDSLVIATRYHPLPIFQATLLLLRPSQPFVVFCEYIEVRRSTFSCQSKHRSRIATICAHPELSFFVCLCVEQPLAECFRFAKDSGNAIKLMLVDTWMREYQVRL